MLIPTARRAWHRWRRRSARARGRSGARRPMRRTRRRPRSWRSRSSAGRRRRRRRRRRRNGARRRRCVRVRVCACACAHARARGTGGWDARAQRVEVLARIHRQKAQAFWVNREFQRSKRRDHREFLFETQEVLSRTRSNFVCGAGERGRGTNVLVRVRRRKRRQRARSGWRTSRWSDRSLRRRRRPRPRSGGASRPSWGIVVCLLGLRGFVLRGGV